nr:hypothetical protein [Patescibacteria group bacterium]
MATPTNQHPTIDAETIKKLAVQAQLEHAAALKFRQPRIADWRANEELYYNKKVPSLKGRHNVNLPIMVGFVDALLSRIDTPPSLQFKHTEEADLMLAQKVTACWALDSSPNHGNWGWKDLLAKKLAIFTGRGIFKYYADSSDGQYRSHLDICDTYDFLIDPNAGGESEEHARYLGLDNIFLDKAQLNSPYYLQTAVAEIIKNTDERQSAAGDTQREKEGRLALLGLSLDEYRRRSGVFQFTEWFTTYEGKRWYLVMDMDGGQVIRAVPLTVQFEKINPETKDAYWPFASFAPKPDKFVYWNPAPADDVREINISLNITINQALDNRQKVNFNQRAYDARVFRSPQLLKWMPDGLVPAVSDNGNIQTAIYEFKTNEFTGTFNLLEFFENFIGRMTGVTPGVQGQGQEDKVGIYLGNLDASAERFGLVNKSYSNMYVKLGQLYLNGLYDHLTEERAVRRIGEKGIEWEDKISKAELADKEFDIIISGSRTEQQEQELKKTRQSEWLARNANNPRLNPRFLDKLGMQAADFSDDQIAEATTLDGGNNAEILAEAAGENQKLF